MSTAEDLWVFGYGSIMWRPGFDFEEVLPARLYGYHRAFCVYSWHHRGTREQPGLVLGLDDGGSCIGRAYRVDNRQAEGVIAYLDAREMVTSVYVPIKHPVHTEHGRLIARCYIVDKAHDQYAGKLPFDEQARIVAQGRGASGINVDYLRSTVAHLDELGITDGPLHDVWELLAAQLHLE